MIIRSMLHRMNTSKTIRQALRVRRDRNFFEYFFIHFLKSLSEAHSGQISKIYIDILFFEVILISNP